jgi:chitinase
MREGCPSGWVHIKRSDPRGKKDEYMYDESSCGPDGVHKFCCPPTSQPSCGWYTQTNGNCDSKCPTDMVEIGSYNSNCKKAGTYQSACCSSNYKSMKLYTKGEWGKYPMCEETSSCPAGDSKKKDLLGSASAGSGQAHCNAYYKGHVLPKDPPNERKFCCDGSNEKERFSDCIMFGGVGLMPSGAPKNWCLSGCPNNRVRIGMGSDKECANFSYRALCCVPNISDTIQIENPKLETYRDALGEFMKAPRCEIPGPFEKRHSLALAKRELRYPYDVTNHILLALLAKTVGNSMNDKMEEAWNAAMGTRFNNLHFPSLRKYVTGLYTYETQGPIALSHQIVCNLNMWNLRAAGNDTERTLFCYDTSCSDGSCDWTPDSSEGDAQSARDGSLSESLEFRERRLAKRHHHHHRHVHGHESNGTSPTPSVLIKRSNRDFTAQLRNPDGTTGSITVTLAEVSLKDHHYQA